MSGDGWVGEVDYLASTMSSPGVIEGLVFHVKRGSLFSCWGNMVRLVVGRTLSSVSR